MILLFLSLVLTAASDEQLIESWECGSHTMEISVKLAEGMVDHCHYAVKDSANLCCKAHDICYEVHTLRPEFTRDFCDTRFASCLQDIREKNKLYECTAQLDLFYAGAKNFGENAYHQAKPTDRSLEFADFKDLRPLNLDVQSLLGACRYSQMLVVHCHNSAQQCLEKDHERIRRLSDEETIVTHPYQDCRATMKDCVEKIIEYAPTENCVAAAESIKKQVNVYTELEENKHGKAIIEAYPINGARLIKQCTNSEAALTSCYLSFDGCAKNNRREHPKLYNAALKIKIECHQRLSACIRVATSEETNEHCLEARSLAINRIRELDLPPVKTFYEAMKSAAADYFARTGTKLQDAVAEAAGKAKDAVVGGATFVGRVAKAVGSGFETVYDNAKNGLKTMMSWRPWG